MPPRASAQPEPVEINRSELRQNQSSVLRKAWDARYWSSPPQKKVRRNSWLIAPISTTRRKAPRGYRNSRHHPDKRLFARILAAAETLDDDFRKHKLHSFEEAFGAK